MQLLHYSAIKKNKMAAVFLHVSFV